MLNFLKPSIFFISIVIFSLQGCGNENSANTPYTTTLGTSISVTSTDENTVMAPNTNTVNNISKALSDILKSDISEFNKKTTVELDKETNYCDISGLKESQNIALLDKIINSKNYEQCQDEKTLQQGKLAIEYLHVDTEGKYPKGYYLTVKEDYRINNIELKKDLTIESSITYHEDKSINAITLKINGEITMDAIDYGLLNIEQTITY